MVVKLVSPFQQVCLDILYEIVSRIIESANMDDAFEALWACSEVCAFWRRFLLAQTRLWSMIIYLNPQDPFTFLRSTEVIKRAGNLDLTVQCILVSAMAYDTAVLGRLSSIWDRVKNLHLIIPGHHAANNIWDELLVRAAPTLQTFYVSYDGPREVHPDEDVYRPAVTFSNEAPQLLVFCSPFGVVFSDVQWLRHLSVLDFCPNYHFLTDLLPSLFPNLQSLRLRQRVGSGPIGGETPNGPPHSSPPIILPRLQSLVVDCIAEDWSTCIQFLRRLQCKGFYFRLECADPSYQIPGDGIAALLDLHLIQDCFQRVPVGPAIERGPTSLKFTKSHMEIRCPGIFEFSVKHGQGTQDWKPWMAALVRLLHSLPSYWAQVTELHLCLNIRIRSLPEETRRHLRGLFGSMSSLEDLELLGPKSLYRIAPWLVAEPGHSSQPLFPRLRNITATSSFLVKEAGADFFLTIIQYRHDIGRPISKLAIGPFQEALAPRIQKS